MKTINDYIKESTSESIDNYKDKFNTKKLSSHISGAKMQMKIDDIFKKFNIPHLLGTFLRQGIQNGFITFEVDNKTRKFGISKENIGNIIDPETLNAEQLDRLIEAIEDIGIKFKYNTNKEWKKAGLEDPEEA